MDFGAAGDGSRPDDAAIKAAFAARAAGQAVLFPQGKRFLLQKLVSIPIASDIEVLAEGASFLMADFTGYNAIALEAQVAKGGYAHHIVWRGGTFDGRKARQSWPGSPSGRHDWTVERGNYGLLTIRGAAQAVVEGVRIVDSVYDGVNVFECRMASIQRCSASGGAPLNYSAALREFERGRQATYFKATRTGSQTAYFLDLKAEGGSIGVHFSNDKPHENSLAVVKNCVFRNQSQDALHFEHCRRIYLDSLDVRADDAAAYRADVHVSNATVLAIVRNSRFHNAKLDFRNASALEIGLVERCQFRSDARSAAAAAPRCLVWKATHVRDCLFEGWAVDMQVMALQVEDCTFRHFDRALQGPNYVAGTRFEQGRIAIADVASEAKVCRSGFADVGTALQCGRRQDRKSSLALSEVRFDRIQTQPIKVTDWDSLVLSGLVVDAAWTGPLVEAQAAKKARPGTAGLAYLRSDRPLGQRLAGVGEVFVAPTSVPCDPPALPSHRLVDAEGRYVGQTLQHVN